MQQTFRYDKKKPEACMGVGNHAPEQKADEGEEEKS